MQSSNSLKKVTLNDDNHDVTFTLDTISTPQTLNIYCKEHDTSSEYWGSFKLTDLQPHYQAIFERIENLYHYISQKTEEIQVQESGSIKIQLNFLKQSREISLKLSRMVMCSADDQKRQQERIKYLQSYSESLRVKLSGQGGNGLNKLTLPLSNDTFNTVSYRVANFCEVAPITQNYLLNLVKFNAKTQLPKNGLWFFHILVTDFVSDYRGRPFPLVELGVKSQGLETSIITLNSNLQHQSFQPLQEGRKHQGFLEPNDIIRVIFNMQEKEMALERNFRHQQCLSWKHLKGQKVWPYVRLFMTNAKTDLFLQEENIAWGFGQS